MACSGLAAAMLGALRRALILDLRQGSCAWAAHLKVCLSIPQLAVAVAAAQNRSLSLQEQGNSALETLLLRFGLYLASTSALVCQFLSVPLSWEGSHVKK